MRQTEPFMETLEKIPGETKLENAGLFMALVDRVNVGDGLTFVLRDGTEHKVNGER